MHNQESEKIKRPLRPKEEAVFRRIVGLSDQSPLARTLIKDESSLRKLGILYPELNLKRHLLAWNDNGPGKHALLSSEGKIYAKQISQELLAEYPYSSKEEISQFLQKANQYFVSNDEREVRAFNLLIKSIRGSILASNHVAKVVEEPALPPEKMVQFQKRPRWKSVAGLLAGVGLSTITAAGVYLGFKGPTPQASAFGDPTGTGTFEPTSTLVLTDAVDPTASSTWTFTPSHTPTETPSQTASPTDTDVPSETPSQTPTHTATLTETPTETSTNTPSATATETPSQTASPTDTDVPSETPSQTPTDIPTNTSEPTQTMTPTDTPTEHPTLTPTPSSTPTEVAPPPLELPSVSEVIGGLEISDIDIKEWTAIGTGERENIAQITLMLAKRHSQLGLHIESPGQLVSLAEKIWITYRSQLLSGELKVSDLEKDLQSIVTEVLSEEGALSESTSYGGLVKILNDKVATAAKDAQLAYYTEYGSRSSGESSLNVLMGDYLVSIYPQLASIDGLNQLIQQSLSEGKPVHIVDTEYYLGGDGFFLPDGTGPMYDCTGVVSMVLEGLFQLPKGELSGYATSHWLAAINTETQVAQIGELEFSVRKMSSIRDEFYDSEGNFKSDLTYPPGTVIIFSTPGVMNHALVAINSAGGPLTLIESSRSLNGSNVYSGAGAIIDRLVGFLNDDVYNGDGRSVYIFTPVK